MTKQARGQALVEFALIVPLLMVLLACVVEFGWTYYQLYYLNNGARMVARVLADQSTGDNSNVNAIALQTVGPVTLSASPTVTVTSVVVSGSTVTLGAAASATDRTAGNVLTVHLRALYIPFTRLVDLRNFGGPSELRARASFVIRSSS